jgi:DNA-binding response OmpR family regulator
LIEDEKDLADSVVLYFEPEGYIIDRASTFAEVEENLIMKTGKSRLN